MAKKNIKAVLSKLHDSYLFFRLLKHQGVDMQISRHWRMNKERYGLAKGVISVGTHGEEWAAFRPYTPEEVDKLIERERNEKRKKEEVLLPQRNVA